MDKNVKPPIMTAKDDITKKLREAFLPESLEVTDQITSS